MNEIDQVFTPIVIADVPFPQQNLMDTSLSSSSPTNGQGVQTTQDAGFPPKHIAFEVMSSALNTRSKKIMQDFSFSQSGALQIGNYEQGISGDVSITPNGITARDISGNTTLALDGNTGDAIFAGEVRSGSSITGEVVIVGGGHILMLDTNGIPSIYIGEL